MIPGNHHTKTQNMIYYQISKIYPKKLGQTVGEILGRYSKNIPKKNRTGGSSIDIF